MSRNKNEENQMRNKGVMIKESEIMPKMRFLVTATLGAYQHIMCSQEILVPWAINYSSVSESIKKWTVFLPLRFI